MATKLFMRSAISTSELDRVGWIPSPAAWLASSTFSLGDFLDTPQGSAATHVTENTAAGPATRWFTANVSLPLSAAATISGTVTLNIRCLESSMTANIGARVEIYRLISATGQLSAQLLTTPNFGTEMSTSERAENWTSAISSTGFQAGDRIVAYIGFTDTGGTQNAGNTSQLFWDGTAGATGDTWIQFTENLTFDTSTPAGTTLYLTNAASDISTADTDLVASLGTRGSGSVTATLAPGAGPLSPTQFQVSSVNVRWYTPALSAVTLSGRVDIHLWIRSSLNNSAGVVVKLIKRTAGGTETDICYAVFGEAEGAASYLNNTAGGVDRVIGMMIPDTVSLSDGDRIGVIVYDDDAYSFTHTTSTETLYYSGVTSAAQGDTYLTVTQTLTEFVAAAQIPYTNPMPQLLAQ